MNHFHFSCLGGSTCDGIYFAASDASFKGIRGQILGKMGIGLEQKFSEFSRGGIGRITNAGREVRRKY